MHWHDSIDIRFVMAGERGQVCDSGDEFIWQTGDVMSLSSYRPGAPRDEFSHLKMDWRRDFHEFHIGAGKTMDRRQFHHVVLPYWSITIPMTLLSACLILWKPRPKPKVTPNA